MMISLIFLIIILLAVATLLFPVTISINSTRSDAIMKGNIQLNWLIFAFIYTFKEKHLEIFVLNWRMIHHMFHEKKQPKSKYIKKLKELRKSRTAPSLRDILNLSGPLMRLFKDIIHAFRLKCFDIQITFGLNDPACNGIMTGLMHAVRGSFGIRQNFRFTPDFTRTVLEWNLKGKASITPVELAVSFVKFSSNGKVLRLALRSISYQFNKH